ncbi:hypothetical protein [Kiloniella antarctica]|uniref:SAM-dependent methyltransferase n=1 Tax=Kiloniella antarctica TaxID=1550907 RepID=A0ABW5BND6_9PROT
MKTKNLKKIQKWLKKMPSLNELCYEFPEEWSAVQQAISSAAQNQNPADLINSAIPPHNNNTKARSSKDKTCIKLPPELAQYVRQRMLQLVIKNRGLAEVTGVKHGKIKFNFLNGYIVQKLLFSHDLERKPVSLFWFRFIWPMVWQKNFLMPLVEPKGIYCFYSRKLIDELAGIIGAQSCLEIAAGDGTLSRFLNNLGVKVAATDNGSWDHSIDYSGSINKLDAKTALKTYNPEVVICSWPPAGNDFETHVFKTSSVQTYIVIGSRLKTAAGNWKTYKAQSAFDFEENRTLSDLLLPPELGSAIYIFRRKQTT